MSLRVQLLAVALLTLVLPVMGLPFIQEMELALRAALEQSLLARAATVATALEERSAALCTPPDCDPHRAGATIYATTLSREPDLDGVRDSHWNTAPDAGLPIDGGQSQSSAANTPPGRSTRAISTNVGSGSIQWSAWTATTRSAQSSGNPVPLDQPPA